MNLPKNKKDGFVFLNKPLGISSFKAVSEVRKIFGVKRVGHSGTLDPLATGLLIIGVGEATKVLQYLVGLDKVYRVRAKFGFVSTTYDADGEILSYKKLDDNLNQTPQLSLEEIKSEIDKSFLGSIVQKPPLYSAVKINGRPAYAYARSGVDVSGRLKGRAVNISNFSITSMDWPFVEFEVACSSGTYIRSLINDLGENLGIGAYVESLERLSIGNFTLSESCKLGDLSKKVEQLLVPLETVVKRFPFINLNDEEFEALESGKFVMNKKYEHKTDLLAFNKDKFIGVLEWCERDWGVGLKYQKKIV